MKMMKVYYLNGRVEIHPTGFNYNEGAIIPCHGNIVLMCIENQNNNVFTFKQMVL